MYLMKKFGTPNKYVNVKPLVFLCGPFNNPDDNNDRRNILRKAISKIKIKEDIIKVEPFALIIDNIFKNPDDLLNISLLEEIISACSYHTYVYLDTLSTALELGLFSNSYLENKITVLLPDDYEVNEPHFGFFIQQTIKNSSSIQLVYYENSRIMNRKENKNFITFKENKLPIEIESKITTDFEGKISDDFAITIEFSTNALDTKKIFYKFKDDKLTFKLTSEILFCLVILYNNKDNIINFLMHVFKDHHSSDPSVITLYYKYSRKTISVDIVSSFSRSIDLVIDSIRNLKEQIGKRKENIFSPIHYRKLDFESVNSSYNLVTIDIIKLFEITKSNNYMIYNYGKNNHNFAESKKIVINGKKRKITMYKNNSSGAELRQYHAHLTSKLDDFITLSNYSFAYKQGISIVDCLNIHKDSTYFLKVDLKDFFNSIKKGNWNKILKCHLSDSSEILYKKAFIERKRAIKYESDSINNWSYIEKVFSTCFHNGQLPLGFVSSPLISNLYLDFFDKRIGSQFFYLKYTRYSDDILISSNTEFNAIDVLETITKELMYLGLTINVKKTHMYHLASIGDHVKFLGINIVMKESGNVLTIGKKEINRICLEICEFEKNRRFADPSIIIGKINFIINVSNGNYEYLKKLYFLKTQNEFNFIYFKDYLKTNFMTYDEYSESYFHIAKTKKNLVDSAG